MRMTDTHAIAGVHGNIQTTREELKIFWEQQK
jgi:hypothetical protein